MIKKTGLLLLFSALIISNIALAKGPLDPVIAFYKDKDGIIATFEQQVQVKNPKRVLKRSGKAYFKKGGFMRWDYLVPDKVYYISDSKVLWIYNEDESEVYRMSVNKSPLYAVLGILFDVNRVYEAFKCRELQSKDQKLSSVLLLPEGQAPIKQATVYFERSTGKVVKVSIVDNVGNTSTIIFKSQEYKPLKDSVFKLIIPEGIRVQDLDKAQPNRPLDNKKVKKK